METHSLAIEINRPREEVVELFLDPTYAPHWQPGFQSHELIEGDRGKVGAKHRIVFAFGDQTVEFINTVIESDLPETYAAKQEGPQGDNVSRHRCVEVDADHMRWECETTYNLTDPQLKQQVLDNPDTFRNQNPGYMQMFKAFCEGRPRT